MTAPNGGPGEPGAARQRETLKPSSSSSAEGSVWPRLTGWAFFRPTLALGVATLGALILAPSSTRRNYPTDPRLIGTPSGEKIKAPFDFEVVDEETTARQREEAAAATRRAYDFDTRLATTTAKRIGAAFAHMAERRATFRDAHPELDDPERLPRSTQARLEEQLSLTLEEARPEFERLLGVPLTGDELGTLHETGFAAEVGQGLASVMIELLAQPVVNKRATLRDETAHGITIQRIPDDGTPDIAVLDVSTIPDLADLRERLPALLERTLSQLRPEQRASLQQLVERLLDANLTVNMRATEIARELARVSVNAINISYKEGEILVRDGERLTERTLAVFTELSRRTGDRPRLVVILAIVAWILLLFAIVFVRRGEPRIAARLDGRDLLFLAGLFLIMLLLLRGWVSFTDLLQTAVTNVPPTVFLFVAPVAAGTLIARMVLRLDVALAFALVQSLTIGLLIDVDQTFLAYAIVGSVLGALTMRTLSRRSDLLRAGVWIGAGQAGVVLVTLLAGGHITFSADLAAVGAALASGLLAAIVALALTSVVESVFGYTTDLKLLELANLNHPALKELIVQAPGSYHHSIIVGSLVEAAAEEIGAKALLARVMAYYHDVGKSQNPAYFVENQRGGVNPHNKLKPNMSAMILRRHISDGLELSKRYGLGDEIRSGIAEHHGTTLIRYFFDKAKEAEVEDQPVAELDYRYAGPKPQSREAALVMLGDAVEAAARSLTEPAPARLQGVVHRVINIKFTDGQLDECDLTLRDLHAIARAFARILNSIYHERLEYPGALGELGGKKADGDLDQKPARRADRPDEQVEGDRPDDLRRLGLD